MAFKSGKRLGLMIRNEYANPIYTTAFMSALFTEEGGDLFDVRQAILGHLQQGGDPSPFDRIQATRFASECIDYLINQANSGTTDVNYIGLTGGKLQFHHFEDFPRVVDFEHQRPKDQWWLTLRSIAKLLAQPVSGFNQPQTKQYKYFYKDNLMGDYYGLKTEKISNGIISVEYLLDGGPRIVRLLYKDGQR